MSDYDGPSEQVRVRFTRDWFKVIEGTECEATYYPELKGYYVHLGNGQHIGGHPTHEGLLERLTPRPGGDR